MRRGKGEWGQTVTSHKPGITLSLAAPYNSLRVIASAVITRIL